MVHGEFHIHFVCGLKCMWVDLYNFEKVKCSSNCKVSCNPEKIKCITCVQLCTSFSFYRTIILQKWSCTCHS